VLLEYKHIGAFASKAIFSSLSSSSAAALTKALPSTCEATTTGIDALLETRDRKRVCLLDPKATQELAPTDAELFDACLFGGILGP
jgi:ribosome biogenesis SPOUT family RNA methylase Rps3